MRVAISMTAKANGKSLTIVGEVLEDAHFDGDAQHTLKIALGDALRSIAKAGLPFGFVFDYPDMTMFESLGGVDIVVKGEEAA